MHVPQLTRLPLFFRSAPALSGVRGERCWLPPSTSPSWPTSWKWWTSRPTSWWRSLRSRQGRVRSTASTTSPSVPWTLFVVSEQKYTQCNKYVCERMKQPFLMWPGNCSVGETVFLLNENKNVSCKSLSLQKLRWERRFMPKIILTLSMSSPCTSELIELFLHHKDRDNDKSRLHQ